MFNTSGQKVVTEIYRVDILMTINLIILPALDMGSVHGQAKGEIVKDIVKKSPVNVSEQRMKREQYESSAESDGRNPFPKLSPSIALELRVSLPDKKPLFIPVRSQS